MTDRQEHFVVTGASQGMGRAIAIRLAEALPASRLSLLARTEESLGAVAAACEAHGAQARIYPCDLTVETSAAGACEQLLRDSGAPTLYVNNAGTFMPGGIRETTFDTWKRQMDINLTSAFHVASRLVPPMIDAGSGHVIFVTSVAAIRGYPRGLAYCASKHGLLGLARAVREETKTSGLRVTALIPGSTRTSSWDDTDLPDERFISPEDIAEAVLGVYRLSGRSVVEEMLIRPQLGDI